VLTDVLGMQDRIAGQVVATLVPAVRRHELAHARRKQPDSITAYDLTLQAIDLLYRLDKISFERARGLLQRAEALEAGYAPIFSHTATWHMFRIGQGWSTDQTYDVAEAARYAASALERDGNDAVALAIHGHMLSFSRHDYGAAIHFLDRAVLAGPSCHMAWTLSSATHGYIGAAAVAVECAKQALELSPLDPFVFFSEHMLSQALYVSGDYEGAVVWGRRSAERNSLLTSNLRTLAAALVATGCIREARKIAQRMLSIEPSFRLRDFGARTPLTPKILEGLIPQLHAAGLPD
jgi:adenylate cyclase